MIGLFVGAALGPRFKIGVVIPAFAILTVFAVGAGLTQARTAWHIVVITTTAATSLQTGYFLGNIVRHLLTAAFSRRSASLTSAPAPARHNAR
jgi:hypothetical protein